MVCMICCPCTRKTGTLLVGILDLIIGSAGLAAVVFLLHVISKQISDVKQPAFDFSEHDRLHILNTLYWSVMLSYVFPASVTLLAGVFAIFAAAHNNDCCAIASILLTIMMVFACGGIVIILYILGLEWHFIIPLIIITLLHMYNTFVLLSYRSNDLKAQQSV